MTAQTKPVWTAKTILAAKIEFIALIMADIDSEDKNGQKMFRVFRTYLEMLIRQREGFSTDADEFEDMKAVIEPLDECFWELREEPEMQGWFFGNPSGNNMAYALANLLIQVRNELLISIAKYTEARKFDRHSLGAQRAINFIVNHLDRHRIDSGFLSNGVLAFGAKIPHSDVPDVIAEIKESGYLLSKQNVRGAEFSRTEPYWTAAD